jgi:hypothetical protein
MKGAWVIFICLFLSTPALTEVPRNGFVVLNSRFDEQLLVGAEAGDVLRIKNVGPSPITELQLAIDLKDGKTGRRLYLQDACEKSSCTNLQLQQNDEKEVRFRLPEPIWAGTYSGSLYVVDPRIDTRVVPMFLRLRGPVPGQQYWVPFVLFTVVVLGGFGLSSKLDTWMGTELPRAQAVQSLRNSQSEILRLSARLLNWSATHGGLNGFVLTAPRLDLLIAALNQQIVNAYKTSAADVTRNAEPFYLASQKVALLSVAIDEIEKTYRKAPSDPPTLAAINTIIDKMDALDVTDPSVVAMYRGNLANCFGARPAVAGRGTAPPSIATPSFNPAALTVTQLQRRIDAMIWVSQGAVWLVVYLTALQTLYLANTSFGSLVDYIACFLWSLSLTQTGKQLVTRTH